MTNNESSEHIFLLFSHQTHHPILFYSKSVFQKFSAQAFVNTNSYEAYDLDFIKFVNEESYVAGSSQSNILLFETIKGDKLTPQSKYFQYQILDVIQSKTNHTFFAIQTFPFVVDNITVFLI